MRRRLDDPLFAEAAAWLGRDPESGAPVPQPDIADIAEVTAEPRLYGFHATLKPPMRLADGRQWDDVVRGRGRTGRPHRAVRICRALAVSGCASASSHCARPCRCPPLQALADACVEQLDPLRAPPSEAELARRRRAKLTARQDAMLVRWGYPYVFDTWFFHMTLTRRLSAEEKHVFMPAAEAILRACDRDAAPGDGYLPVRAASAGRAVRHRGTSEAARLSAARKRATPSSSDPSFTTVSTGMSDGNATLRASRSAMSAALSRRRDARSCREDFGRRGDLDHAHREPRRRHRR